MQFVSPNFLWALLFIAVPIIIHLFYFRRYKKVMFSNVAFLNEVKDENSTRNKLKHLLVLLSRILAIICLVFAFAQPFFPKDNQKQTTSKEVSIYIDNSFSMNAEGNGLLLLDEAKEITENIINSYAENDPADAYRYQILTNDFEGKHQRLVNKTEALSLLKDIEISASWQQYQTIYDRQAAVFKNEAVEQVIFQVSDYQENNTLFNADTSITTSIVKLNSKEIRNIYIDSVWFQNSFQLKDASNQLIVKIRNESDAEAVGNYQMVLSEEVKAVGNYTIPKFSFTLDTIVFKINDLGWNTGKVQLSDYPITFDDNYFFSFFVEEKVNVLSIGESNQDPIFNAVFKAIGNINFENKSFLGLDYNNLETQHFIILNEIKTLPSGLAQRLKKYLENGGNVLIIPNKDANLSTYNTFLSAINLGSFGGIEDENKKVSNINLKHYVLNDLFERTPKDIELPSVKRHFLLRNSQNGTEQSIMSYRNGENFLSSYQYNSGSVYLMTSSLASSASDFASNALFAPMIYKMAVLSVNNSTLSFQINANTKITLNKNIKTSDFQLEDIVKVRSEVDANNALEFIPQKNMFGGVLNLNVYQNNLAAGIYDVVNQKQSTSKEEQIAKVALNYNRKESKLKYFSEEALESHFVGQNVNIISGNINSIKENIINIEDGKQVWKWFIIFSLLFLAFEMILLRILK